MATVVVPRIAGAVAYDPTAIGITGGTSRWDEGSKTAPSISFAADGTSGIYDNNASGYWGMSYGGVDVAFVASQTFALVSNATMGWSSGTAPGARDLTLTRQAAGRLCLNSGTATPAGGATSLALVFGSTSGFGIYIGSGVPTVSAAQGSLYLCSNGSSTSTRAYINSSSGSGTTWTAITTAA